MTIATNSIESFSDFVNKLEEVYKNQSVYRTLIVYGLKKNGAIYKYLLEHNNNTVYMINEDKYSNYDKLDYRILMIEQNKYDKFIDNNGNDFFSHLINTPCCKK
jgi:hypothetical protein|tara:strand:- start:200 stop:511 length:312 start_codon:yes stop_codon:yes gene_type:complete